MPFCANGAIAIAATHRGAARFGTGFGATCRRPEAARDRAGRRWHKRLGWHPRLPHTWVCQGRCDGRAMATVRLALLRTLVRTLVRTHRACARDREHGGENARRMCTFLCVLVCFVPRSLWARLEHGWHSLGPSTAMVPNHTDEIGANFEPRFRAGLACTTTSRSTTYPTRRPSSTLTSTSNTPRPSAPSVPSCGLATSNQPRPTPSSRFCTTKVCCCAVSPRTLTHWRRRQGSQQRRWWPRMATSTARTSLGRVHRFR